MEDSYLTEVAMQIILHAGNARNYAEQALEKTKEKDLDEVEKLLGKSEEEILEAHRSQTKIIQNEASGNTYEQSLLFNHAQDTLMTSMSEIRIIKQLIEMYQLFFDNEKLAK